MAFNLVTSIMQLLTPDVMAKIAPALGLDRNTVQNASGAVVPAILAGLTKVVSSPDGTQQLSSALAQQQQQIGGLDQVKNMLGGPGQKTLVDSGMGMLSSLLGGSGLNTLVGAVSKFAGINTGTGKSLIGLIGPLVLGALGQQQHTNGLDPNGLASLLTSQKDNIASAMPSGLSDLLSGGGLFDTVNTDLQRGAAQASAAASQFADRSGEAFSGAGQAAYTAATNASRKPSSLPYWLGGLIALLGLGWYLTSHTGDRQVAERTPTATAPQTITSSVNTGVARVTAADVADEIASSVNDAKTALLSMTNPNAARTAIPKLQQISARLDRVTELKAQLPATAKQGLAASLATGMPTFNQLCDKILATPGVASIAKPTIDALRTKLETLSQA